VARGIRKGEMLENIVGVYFELCNLEGQDRIRADSMRDDFSQQLLK
jgi:hypothetical protein